MDRVRCSWVTDDVLYKQYHDEEWGNIAHFQNDIYLFEMLTLEGAQAGLSWLTVLKRRENYRRAFDAFDPQIVSEYDEAHIEALLHDEGIIRNRRKIQSTVNNAKAFLEVQRKYGSFHQFLYEFIGRKQIVNQWESAAEVPAATPLSTKLSNTLKAYGFTFVGPIICYSFMQAVGLVNDHTKKCFLYKGE